MNKQYLIYMAANIMNLFPHSISRVTFFTPALGGLDNDIL